MKLLINLEVTDKNRVQDIEDSAKVLVARILEKGIVSPLWNLRDMVWPSSLLPEYSELPDQVTLHLFPLVRIGQMEGKSGSQVLIGYFSSDDCKSNLLVVKTRPKKENGAEDALKIEHDNAQTIKPLTYACKDSVAIPIFTDQDRSKFSVLWSICFAEHASDGSEFSNVKDLRNLFADEMPSIEIGKHFSTVFTILRGCHTRLDRPRYQPRKFGDEYGWYLREFSEDSDWGRAWTRYWAPSDRATLDGGGVNPICVLKRLCERTATLQVGYIHGDLHLGNILLPNDRASLIDFGWAHDDAHVTKDFVLLECNLRFLLLRPQIPEKDLLKIANWISWDESVPPDLDGYLNLMCDFIRQVRGSARAVLEGRGAPPRVVNWDEEYLAPLFLVAFGLLRFAPQLGNQRAAILTIERLANHIGGGMSL